MGSSDAGLKSHRYSTVDLPTKSQFEAWRALMSSNVELTRVGEDDGFPADLVAWDFGGLVLAEMRMPSRGFARVWRHLKQPLSDHWCLVLSLDTVPGVPGERQGRSLSFRSLGRPFTGQGDEAHLVSLFLPRDQFADVAARLDSVPAAIPDEALGALLADFMLCLGRRLPEMKQADLQSLVEVTRATVTACLAPTAEHLAGAARPLALTLVERARAEIRRNIESPGFGATELCRALGVSRSRLYRLFEPFGGVANYIRRQRLLFAHAALSNPSEARQIREIGEAFGFGDASGFSRAFHAEFGYTPRDARAAALAGIPLQPTVARTAATSDDGGFAALLVRPHGPQPPLRRVPGLPHATRISGLSHDWAALGRPPD